MSRKLICGFAAIGTLLFLLSPIAGYGRSAEESPAEANTTEQALLDTRIIMADPNVFKELERPPVLFDHKRHTEALKDRTCNACHIVNKKGTLTYEFLRLEEGADRRSIIVAYHEKCGQCHGGALEGREEADGLGCGECHVKKVEYQAAEWYPALFEHVDHMEAMEEGCGTCHHTFDENLRKLRYEEGAEATCGNCHGKKDKGTKGALHKVGHIKCIGCHEQQYQAGARKQDPYECQSCHKLEEPAGPETEMLAIRPYQAKPTNLLIGYPGSILPPVPYDHQKHIEGKTCSKSCHAFHVRTLAEIDVRFLKTGDACRQCHTQAEVKMTADAISAHNVYHDAASPHSCIGCHKEENKKASKADSKAPVKCKDCHTGEKPEVTLAEAGQTPPPEGPETYIISRLSNKRLPVEFRHGLHAKMIDNCSSCHHDSPKDKQPPCDTCHGISEDFAKKSKISLVSAYHRMCLGCHRNVGIGPITCVKCHEERETQNWAADAVQPAAAKN